MNEADYEAFLENILGAVTRVLHRSAAGHPTQSDLQEIIHKIDERNEAHCGVCGSWPVVDYCDEPRCTTHEHIGEMPQIGPIQWEN